MRRRSRRVSQKPYLNNPFLIVWEIMKPPISDWGSLQLPEDQPQNFSLVEKKAIIDQIAQFGQIKLVLSGGNLFQEEDLLTIIKYAISKDLRVSVRPTLATQITRDQIQALKDSGVISISINLDGPNEIIHDSLNDHGSFVRTSNLIIDINDIGIPLQINTALSKQNLPHIKELAENIKMYSVVLWNIAMTLVDEQQLLSTSECELFYHWLYDYSKGTSFDIKTTSGQQFHRVVIQNKRRENKISGNYIHYRDALLKSIEGVEGGIERAPYGINDGKGMMFISASGSIYPSSMLPIKLGHIKEDNLVDIYRNNNVIKDIKNSDLLKGKCGFCEFRNVCGGSRARAYLLTNDYLQSDPACFYKPSKYYRAESIILQDD